MARKQKEFTSAPRSYVTFISHFAHYCFVLRSLLGVQFALVLAGGVIFARWEGIRVSQGIYFSLITSTTVGYGDITPRTGLGQCIAVLLACHGTILFGLVVAVATKAFTVTIRDYTKSHSSKPIDF